MKRKYSNNTNYKIMYTANHMLVTVICLNNGEVCGKNNDEKVLQLLFEKEGSMSVQKRCYQVKAFYEKR